MSGSNPGSSSNPGPAAQTATNLQPVLGSFDNNGALLQLYGPGTTPLNVPLNPMTTAGDMIIGGTAGAEARLPVGTAGQVLTVTAGLPAWAATSGSPPAVNAQTGTTYTLALADAPAASANQGIVTMNNGSANTLTIPTNASVAFPLGTIVSVIQLGAGQTTIAAAGGVTLSNPSSATARVQYSTLLLQKVATNTWILGGDMT